MMHQFSQGPINLSAAAESLFHRLVVLSDDRDKKINADLLSPRIDRGFVSERALRCSP
jgi:hypothetical protein